jgi:hypothetical protein
VFTDCFGLGFIFPFQIHSPLGADSTGSRLGSRVAMGLIGGRGGIMAVAWDIN